MAGSGQTMTFAELDDFAWRAARAFRSLGLAPGDHVAYVLEKRLECLESLMAAHPPTTWRSSASPMTSGARRSERSSSRSPAYPETHG
jgi:acyl-coenzyme A synthetase/AMP-(fatty) acid ligase